LEKLLSKEMGL